MTTAARRLGELEAGHNRLDLLPPSTLAGLTGLVRLDLRENRLTALPPLPTRAGRLAELLLGFNRLGAPPSGLGPLSPLVSVLDLRGVSLCSPLTRLHCPAHSH